MGTGPRVAGLGTGRDSTGITGGAFATYVLCTSRKPTLIPEKGEDRDILENFAGKSDTHPLSA